ncbi:hypothetical protein pb186bvf_011484 [Paramecium bursaria]
MITYFCIIKSLYVLQVIYYRVFKMKAHLKLTSLLTCEINENMFFYYQIKLSNILQIIYYSVFIKKIQEKQKSLIYIYIYLKNMFRNNALEKLSKFRKSQRQKIIEEFIIDSIQYGVEEDIDIFFQQLQKPLTMVGQLKYLVLIDTFIYRLQGPFIKRFSVFQFQREKDIKYSRLSLLYFDYLQNLCQNYESFKYVLIKIDEKSLKEFLELSLEQQIIHVLILEQFIDMEIYKMLALLLTNESPLIDQLGTCIAKDFVSIYNFISNIVTIHQKKILELNEVSSKHLYKAYQQIIQVTPAIRKMSKWRIYNIQREPEYFEIQSELNKKFELHINSFVNIQMITVDI